MNSESNKKINPSGNQSAYNWKGVMDFIKEEVKASTSEWASEKQMLIKKINDLEKEVKQLKKTNQELTQKINSGTNSNNAGVNSGNSGNCSTPIGSTLSINGITINSSLNLDRKAIAEKLFHSHKRGDSDKLHKIEVDDKLHKFKGKIAKSKQNSDDITKSDTLKRIYKRKTKSFGGFEKLIENKLIESSLNTKFSQNSTNANNQNQFQNVINNGGNGGNFNSSNIKSEIPVRLQLQLHNSEEKINSEVGSEYGYGFHSSRMNENVSPLMNNKPRVIEFSKALNNVNNSSNSKLSEKEEESSTTTQETIIEKPKNYLDNSQSISNSDNTGGNMMTNSNDEGRESMIYQGSRLNATNTGNNTPDNSHLNIHFYPNPNVNDLKKANSGFSNNNERVSMKLSTNMNTNMNSLSSSKSSKMSHNPFLVFKSHFDSVREVYLCPERKVLVSVGEDMFINFWDFRRARKQKGDIEPFLTLRTHITPIFTLTGPGKEFIESGNFLNEQVVDDSTFGENLTIPNTNNNSVNKTTTINNLISNLSIYTSGLDGVIRSARIPTITAPNSFPNFEDTMNEINPQPWRAHQDMIWDLKYHPSESIMSSVSSDGTVKIFKGYEESMTDKSFYSYDNRSKNLIRQFTFKNHYYNFIEIPTCAYWANNTQKKGGLYVSHIAPYIKLYDVESGKAFSDWSYAVEKNIPFECQQTNKLIFHEGGNMLITGHEDRQIRFFDPSQNKIIKSMVAHTDSVSALSPGVREFELLSGSHDGSIRCWDLRINKLLFDIPAHRKKFDEGCLSIQTYPEEKLVITCGADGLIKAFQF